MCRTGGRRCPNAGGRSTQNTRQAVSRARKALRQAKETGNPHGIAAARERLDTARTTHRHAKDNAVNHHHEGQDHAADHNTTAGHDRDVTTPTPADDTTTGQSTQDSSHRFGGFTMHNTNIAHPGAHVGSQHDVHHGTTRFTTRTGPTPRHDRDVTDHDDEDQDDDATGTATSPPATTTSPNRSASPSSTSADCAAADTHPRQTGHTTTGRTRMSSTTCTITVGTATEVGGRVRNADAVAFTAIPLGTGVAVVDGIGSDIDVCRAARLAADTAAVVAAHRGAQAGIMAAADTMPYYPGAPNAVAAVVSVEPDGRIEIAHVGDAAVYTWSYPFVLRRRTVDQTAGEHIAHMLTNPSLTSTDRERLDRVGDAVDVLADYVLNGLAYATVSTISWTPIRHTRATVDLIVLTSDGVHKPLGDAGIADVIQRHQHDPQALADALVNNALAVDLSDPDAVHDNATAAVIRLD